MRIRMNLFDIIINILCIATLIGFGIFLLINWGDVPDKMPAQYNFSGEVTRWASKNEIFLMPAIALVLYIFITIVEQFPQIWNIPIKVTASNIGPVYRLAKNMISFAKLVMMLIFVIIPVSQVRTMSIPLWLIFSLIGVLVIVIIGHVIAMMRYR